MYYRKGERRKMEGKEMKVTYYAERINGEIKYFKENTDRFGRRVAKIEISNWEYEWATSN